MKTSACVPVIPSIAPLAEETDAWLVDIWGVMHNGVTPFADAVAACRRFKDGGGRVLLLSNAPRPAASVATQLDRIGVDRGAYDGIVTSGDVSRELIRSWSGQNVYHIGPERDLPLFDGTGVRLCRAEDAEVLVCTGLRDDETETPDDYADVLGLASRNELEMICANPDLKVERAGKIVWCAGGVAAAYAALGGRVVYAGKPYLPIYDMAMDRVAEFRGGAVDMRRVLAIGDGVNTDIAGAIAAGLRSLYIASPVHMDAGAALTGEAVAALFASLPGAPVAAMARLSW